MKSSRKALFLAALGLGAIVYFSVSSSRTDEDYLAAIRKERADKDDFMKTDEASPFGTDRSSFTHLNYFEPDLQYVVRAKLEPIPEKTVVVLQTSAGGLTNYLEYAWAVFDLDGVENKLLILEIMDMGPQRGKLFLGFADATSAGETYGAGRYLDIRKVPAATTIELDFNKAYNPYCAYVDTYSCPFPPSSNILKVAIKAGEMVYH